MWKQSALFVLHCAGAKEHYKKPDLSFCQLCSLSPVQPSTVVRCYSYLKICMKRCCAILPNNVFKLLDAITINTVKGVHTDTTISSLNRLLLLYFPEYFNV